MGRRWSNVVDASDAAGKIVDIHAGIAACDAHASGSSDGGASVRHRDAVNAHDDCTGNNIVNVHSHRGRPTSRQVVVISLCIIVIARNRVIVPDGLVVIASHRVIVAVDGIFIPTDGAIIPVNMTTVSHEVAIIPVNLNIVRDNGLMVASIDLFGHHKPDDHLSNCDSHYASHPPLLYNQSTHFCMVDPFQVLDQLNQLIYAITVTFTCIVFVVCFGAVAVVTIHEKLDCILEQPRRGNG